MTSPENTFYSIEHYLRGDLTEIERVTFEEKMAIDTELADEVTAHRLTNELVVDYNLLMLKGEMAGWQKENDSKSSLSKPLIGLSIVVLILAIGALVFQNQKNEEPIKPALSEHPSATKQHEPVAEKQTLVQKQQEQPEVKTTKNQTIEPTEYTVNSEENEPLSLNPKPSVQRKSLTIKPSAVTTPELEIPLPENKICIESLPVDFGQFKGSCEGEMNGQIEFSNAPLNGENPIAFSIDSGATYQQSRNFSFLENGTYHPVLQVSGGCFFTYSQPILLTSGADCRTMETHVINTTKNDYWEPMLSLENAEILIRNSSGALVFSSTLDYQFKWYGTNKNGEELPMGDYIFIVEQSGKSIKSGSITVLR